MGDGGQFGAPSERNEAPPRYRRAHRWRRRCAAGAALVGTLVIVAPALPAGAVITQGGSQCSGSGTFVKPHPKGTPGQEIPPGVVNATEAGTVVIPLKAAVDWQGAIAVPATKRMIDGKITLDLPWPFKTVTVEKWGKDGKFAQAVENKGTESYDLPSLMPRGVEITVRGVHNDVGVTCAGYVNLKLEGGVFKTPYAMISLIATIGLAAFFALAGRPKFKKIWVEHP